MLSEYQTLDKKQLFLSQTSHCISSLPHPHTLPFSHSIFVMNIY